MIRGTTALFKFKLPYSKNELDWATIKFWQSLNPNELLPITKGLDHCSSTSDPKVVYVSLTAEETKRFSDKYKAKVQMRARHSISGTVFGNREKLVSVYPMSDDTSTEDPIVPPIIEEEWIILDGEPIIN